MKIKSLYSINEWNWMHDEKRLPLVRALLKYGFKSDKISKASTEFEIGPEILLDDKNVFTKKFRHGICTATPNAGYSNGSLNFYFDHNTIRQISFREGTNREYHIKNILDSVDKFWELAEALNNYVKIDQTTLWEIDTSEVVYRLWVKPLRTKPEVASLDDTTDVFEQGKYTIEVSSRRLNHGTFEENLESLLGEIRRGE